MSQAAGSDLLAKKKHGAPPEANIAELAQAISDMRIALEQQQKEAPERELALRLYDISKREFVERVKQRDTILGIYGVTASAIVGWVMQKDSRNAILLLIPYLSGACGMLLAYHSKFIESLVHYYQETLKPKIGMNVPLFETSAQFTARAMRGVMFRVCSYLFVLAIPSAIAVWVAKKDIQSSLWTCFMWLSIAATVVGCGSVLLIDGAHIAGVRRRAVEKRVAGAAVGDAPQ